MYLWHTCRHPQQCPTMFLLRRTPRCCWVPQWWNLQNRFYIYYKKHLIIQFLTTPSKIICTLWNFKIYLVYLIFCLAFLSICIDVLFTVYGRYLKNKKFNYYLTDIHYIHIFSQAKVLWRNKLYLLSQHLFIV